MWCNFFLFWPWTNTPSLSVALLFSKLNSRKWDSRVIYVVFHRLRRLDHAVIHISLGYISIMEDGWKFEGNLVFADSAAPSSPTQSVSSVREPYVLSIWTHTRRPLDWSLVHYTIPAWFIWTTWRKRVPRRVWEEFPQLSLEWEQRVYKKLAWWFGVMKTCLTHVLSIRGRSNRISDLEELGRRDCGAELWSAEQ